MSDLGRSPARRNQTDEAERVANPPAAAIHEAGHAVVGWMCGQFVRERGLSTTGDGRGLAHVRSSVVLPRAIWATASPHVLPKRTEKYVDGSGNRCCRVRRRGTRSRHRGAALQRWSLSDDYAGAGEQWRRYWGAGAPELDHESSALALAELNAKSMFRRKGA